MAGRNLVIHFVRHAQTTLNVKSEMEYDQRIIGGRSSWVPLSDAGREQAEQLKLSKDDFTAIYSSPAVRTMSTAGLSLGSNFTLNIDYRLLEWYKGDWEGQLRKDIYDRPDVRQRLDDDNWNMIFGDEVKGECAADVSQRMMDFVSDLAEKYPDGGKILVFTHGYSIKFLLAETLDWDRKTAYKFGVDNVSTSVLYYDGRYQWRMINNVPIETEVTSPPLAGASSESGSTMTSSSSGSNGLESTDSEPCCVDSYRTWEDPPSGKLGELLGDVHWKRLRYYESARMIHDMEPYYRYKVRAPMALNRNVVGASIRYIYADTDYLDLGRLSLEDLAQLAEYGHWAGNGRLAYFVIDYLMTNLEVEKSYELLVYVDRLSYNFVKLFIFDFISLNMEQFLSDKGRLESIGTELVSGVIDHSRVGYGLIPRNIPDSTWKSNVRDFQRSAGLQDCDSNLCKAMIEYAKTFTYH